MDKRFALFCSICLILTGCVSVPNQDISTDPTAEKNTIPKPVETASFEPETLYSLLVAEIAGHRQRFDVLLTNYLHQAEKTRDLGVAERATQIATYLQANKAALNASRIWLEAAPENIKAKHALAIQLIKANQFPEAMMLLEEILEAKNTASFDYLAANSKNLSQNQRNEILVQYNKLLEKHPENTKLLAGKIILLDLNGRKEEALKTATQLHRFDPSTQNLILKARLEHQLGKSELALRDLEQELSKNQKNKQVRLLYAQILIDIKSLDKAQIQFAKLVELYPKDSQVRLTLALLAMENKLFDEAKVQLNELLNSKTHKLDAHFYLAQLAELEKKPDIALEHYRQVDQGSKLMQSHARMGEILVEQNRLADLHTLFEKSREKHKVEKKALYLIQADLLSKGGHLDIAFTLLNVALNEFNDDIGLLYARAMTSDKRNDLVAMEKDMWKILDIDPDNAMVLNALGYTLADKTTRYEEALQLITRAKELKPDDPAITDSLGWAHFRLGNYSQSIKLLEQAFSDFPDHEVAAHLGEALWVNGDKEKAQKIWQDSLQRRPDSPILIRVIQRLNPDLLK